MPSLKGGQEVSEDTEVEVDVEVEVEEVVVVEVDVVGVGVGVGVDVGQTSVLVQDSLVTAVPQDPPQVAEQERVVLVRVPEPPPQLPEQAPHGLYVQTPSTGVLVFEQVPPEQVSVVQESASSQSELVKHSTQVCFVTVVLFRVTAAPFANSLPFIVEPPLSVIESAASMFPTKVEEVPMVAEDPTIQ